MKSMGVGVGELRVNGPIKSKYLASLMAWTEEIFKTENYVTASPTAVEQLGPV